MLMCWYAADGSVVAAGVEVQAGVRAAAALLKACVWDCPTAVMKPEYWMLMAVCMYVRMMQYIFEMTKT